MNLQACSRERLLSFALGAAGAAVVGLICRLPSGVALAAESSIAMPAILFGVSLVLAPALYIALSLTGARTNARVFSLGLINALRACGLVALGLAPALLFMVATTTNPELALAFGVATIGCALMIGLVSLAREAADHSAASLFSFIAWACAASMVGVHMFFRVVLS